MKRIGLIGEDPNDTEAIKNLLNQKFKNLHFLTLLKRKKGYQLDNIATLRALEVELQDHKLQKIIFIRDLDGLKSESSKLKAKIEWFNKLNKISGHKGILLLNIYEIEALILADIEIFNREYKTLLKNIGNVMFKKEPKEFLVQATYKKSKQYRESHCPELFKKIRYDIIRSNCQYFEAFHNEFK